MITVPTSLVRKVYKIIHREVAEGRAGTQRAANKRYLHGHHQRFVLKGSKAIFDFSVVLLELFQILCSEHCLLGHISHLYFCL